MCLTGPVVCLCSLLVVVSRYLTVSPNEEQLICSLENGQVYTLLLSNNEIMKADEMNFDVLGTNNHQGPVTGVWCDTHTHTHMCTGFCPSLPAVNTHTRRILDMYPKSDKCICAH